MAEIVYIASSNKPAQNSTSNENILDAIGQKTDYVTVPYSEGVSSILAYAHTAYDHVHGEAWVYPKYASGVMLTSAAGAWATTGTITQIIPASTLTKNFDIHWAIISDISAEGEYVIDFYKGGVGEEVLISSAKVVRGSSFSQEVPRRIQIPQQAANARISAKLSSSPAGANTLVISLEGHYYT